MRIVAQLRVKDEEEFLERCLRSLLVICKEVVVFDDHSSDRTPEIARSFGNGVRYLPSPFEGLSETRDKNYLLGYVMKLKPDWVLCLDGDEELSSTASETILREIGRVNRQEPECTVFLLRVLYFWNGYDTIRVDGVYGKFFVPRVFTTWGQSELSSLHFLYQANVAGFHCGSIPSQRYSRRDLQLDAPIYHYGYLWPALRRKKFEFYRGHDPVNVLEDNYRHIIQGDPDGESGEAMLKHGGPLKLEQFHVPS